jgi:CHAT domain-containing protein
VVLQRQLTAARPRAGNGVAILADPVFQPDDPRLGSKARAPSAESRTAPGLSRLSFSRREARHIEMTFAGERLLVATDFKATRRLALSPALVDYRIIHFATHGVLDSATALGSALIFASVDEHGRPVDGRVGLHDIYGLRLSADLVVLSACETALGQDVRGEGLIGVTRGFMYAGARRILASLGKVDDAATSELMKAFYSALRTGTTPATALRDAQAHAREQPGWRHPYYWAGFQLHGDWR